MALTEVEIDNINLRSKWGHRITISFTESLEEEGDYKWLTRYNPETGEYFYFYVIGIIRGRELRCFYGDARVDAEFRRGIEKAIGESDHQIEGQFFPDRLGKINAISLCRVDPHLVVVEDKTVIKSFMGGINSMFLHPRIIEATLRGSGWTRCYQYRPVLHSAIRSKE